jgi:hypothetical protein
LLIALFLAVGLLLNPLSSSSHAQDNVPSPQPVRFRALDVFVDSGDKPLAAYQLEVSAADGDTKVAGIEGGEHPAFKQPPFYDPKAIQQERVILAAFNTAAADQLPTGKTRVATLHFQTRGDQPPQYTLKLATAASVDGQQINVSASAIERNGL